MKRDRSLYRYETYLRAGSREVNIATSGREHIFPFARRGIFSASSFSVVIAGANLLSNYHRFGNGDGALHIKMVRKDDLGVRWDRFRMKRSVLDAGEWTGWGIGGGIGSSREVLVGGANARAGVLEPTFHQNFVSLEGLPFSRWLNPGPSWVSGEVPIEGDHVVHVAWDLEDTVDERGDFLDSYRIDLVVTRRLVDGSETTDLLCLTHWDSVVIPSPLPPPRFVPLVRISPTPFGTPIPEVLRKRSRDVSLDVEGAVAPLSAEVVRALVSFDAGDRRLAAQTHLDDLHLKPPGFRKIGIYSEFVDPPEGQGSRAHYVLRSFRELIELSNGLEDSSRAASYRSGDDIAFLTLPIYGQFSTEWEERICVEFSPAKPEDNPLALLEICALDGTVAFRDT